MPRRSQKLASAALATLLATVMGFVFGGLWYGPLFGKTWMRLVGVTEATRRENFNPAKTFALLG